MSCRTTRRLLLDSTFRRWSLWRWRHNWPLGETDTDARLPPYISLSPQNESCAILAEKPQSAPQGRLTLSLPGETLEIEHPHELFDRARNPLLLHGFAWIGGVPPQWMGALWAEWVKRFGQPKQGHPSWNPWATTSRALALLHQAQAIGLPGAGPSLCVHAKQIVSHLQYRGEGKTGSLLALQGHALLRLGLGLGMPQTTEDGLKILLHEARRLILPSGISAEGSSIAHLRLTRAYADSWLAARQAKLPEASLLEHFTSRLLAVIPAITLPGELPLIGDALSCEPVTAFACLHRHAALEGTWIDTLDSESRQAFHTLRDSSFQPDLEALRIDGWLRLDKAPWSGLWHASPSGWPELSGLAHHDQGSFALHYEGVPVFIDPGCAGWNSQDEYAGSCLHNGIELDNQSISPNNRAIYSDAFRRDVLPHQPDLRTESDGVSLDSEGFNRLGGPRETSRRWQFEGDSLSISEHIKGTGRFRITRRLITPFTATQEEDGSVILQGPHGLRFKIEGGIPAQISDAWRTLPNGGLGPVRVIEFTHKKITLPYRAQITVTKL